MSLTLTFSTQFLSCFSQRWKSSEIFCSSLQHPFSLHTYIYSVVYFFFLLFFIISEINFTHYLFFIVCSYSCSHPPPLSVQSFLFLKGFVSPWEEMTSQNIYYSYSSTVVSIFLPIITSAPPTHTSHPQSYLPMALSMGPLYMFLDNPSPLSPFSLYTILTAYCQFVLLFFSLQLFIYLLTYYFWWSCGF